MSKPKRQFPGTLKFPIGTSRSDRILCWDMIKMHVPESNGEIVVACSGGIDSTVLAHAIAQRIRLDQGDSSLTLAYVNHNLRPEVENEIKHVESLASQLSADCVILDGSIDGSISGVQERARKKRYRLLNQLCENNRIQNRYPYLLTAHNANDQAETILFRTITGRAQVKMPKTVYRSWGEIYRPFLRFTRSDIERYAKVFNLTWCEDSSNATDKYTRNKIRHHLIPWIESNINPNVIKSLVGT